MSGHSKWANIKHRKAKQDAQRGKIFTKIGRQIITAVKNGGGADPETNASLKSALAAAREVNMPNENIQRIIARASGTADGVNYEEMVYEGYGPAGVAVLINIMTDNRNRTAGEIRHLFSKNNGNLGESGCVAWMFDKKGIIVVDKDEDPVDNDEFMLTALELGAEDVKIEDNIIEIVSAPEEFEALSQGLIDQGIKYSVAEITMIPQTTVHVEGKDAQLMIRLFEALDDHDDVQGVYANFDIDEVDME